MIELTHSGPVSRVTLNRPEQLNPISSQTVIDLLAAFAEIAERDTRVVVLTGAGRAFSAGVDLDDPLFAMTSAAERQPTVDRAYALTRAMRAAPPIVVGVQGHCVGLGVVMVAASDVRLADASAKFALPYVQRVGVPPDMGATVLLPQLLGPARALEFALSGERLDAAEAVRIGLVGRVVDDLPAALDDVTARVAAGAPLAAAATKRLMYGAIDAALDVEAQAVNGLFDSADFKEARAAMLERRDPEYRGR